MREGYKIVSSKSNIELVCIETRVKAEHITGPNTITRK